MSDYEPEFTAKLRNATVGVIGIVDGMHKVTMVGPDEWRTLTGALSTIGEELVALLPDDAPPLALSVRAPEVAELVAQLPRGEWGADELGTLANWLTGHGYDIGED
jgi:hypothetical protein